MHSDELKARAAGKDLVYPLLALEISVPAVISENLHTRANMHRLGLTVNK